MNSFLSVNIFSILSLVSLSLLFSNLSLRRQGLVLLVALISNYYVSLILFHICLTSFYIPS